MLLLITLEPNNRFRDYRVFGDEIVRVGEARQIMNHTWLLHPRDPSVGVDDVTARLMAHIEQPTDHMFISEVTNRRLNGWLSRELWTWANSHNN